MIAGKEREYCKHFFDKIISNSGAITPQDLDHYALAYSQPGAIRASLEVYRAFEHDAEENKAWLMDNGRLGVPSLLMMADQFLLADIAEGMTDEYHEDPEILTIHDCGHYIAEEQPEEFVKGVLDFIGRH